MFRWYEGSTMCYVYLSDVFHTSFEIDFPASRWFTRGWTLQELLAPRHVIFYDCAWKLLGTKEDHAKGISEITTIDLPILLRRYREDLTQRRLRQFCAAKKMSWAARRDTTRLEDAAYCLMGLFEINMPLLYGEGTKAFHRLQEEIIKVSNDDSILAWDLDTVPSHPQGLVPQHIENYLRMTHSVGPYLASSPRNFAHCGKLQFADQSSCVFVTTNHGLQIQLPLHKVLDPLSKEALGNQRRIYAYLGLLSCSTGSDTECLAITLAPTSKRVDGSKKFGRLRLSNSLNPTSTITVGPRIAFQSTLEKIVISRTDSGLQPGPRYDGFYQVLVTESHRVPEAGYHISNATRHHTRTTDLRRSMWDPVAMVLTTDGFNFYNDPLSFYFSSTAVNPDAGFTVFLHVIRLRAMALEGTTFSLPAVTNVRMTLTQPRQAPKDGIARLYFRTAGGKELHISLRVEEKIVYGWTILDVHVDVTP